ncbi:MAG: VOC family protein, partial [Chloroflexi bacterium]|nr:VOC family protein [Chloroflexota bacterium]
QVAFLANDIQDASRLYQRVLGLEPSSSQDLPEYGLTSQALPTGGGTFIELLEPTAGDSAATRYLHRRGEAPYLLTFQTSDYDRLIPHLKSLDVAISAEVEHAGYRSAFIHPSSANGTLLEIVEVSPGSSSWPPAGPDWARQEGKAKTRQIRQVAILVKDLDQAIKWWGEMFGLRATRRFQISFTDLEIAVIPLEGRDSFIELAQPTNSDTTSARFLERYGEGIYLTIYQIDDSLAVDAHLKGQGIDYTSSRVTPNYVNQGFNSIWLHPRAMKGAFTQLSQVFDPENPWPPAGGTWHLR